MGSGYEEWDTIYRSYSPDELPWELGRPRQSLVELVESGTIEMGKALDICCGLGTNTIYLAKRGFEVTGIDISPTAVEHAKKKAKEENVKVRFMVGDFLKLPFEDGEFNFVFDMGCFHHVEVEDRDTFIKGVYRVLKRGGDYFLTCFSDRNGRAWNHFAKGQIVGLFSGLFGIMSLEHVSTVEGDGRVRHFYQVLMERK